MMQGRMSRDELAYALRLAVNQFFTTWFNALVNAASRAADNVNHIVDEFDKIVQPHMTTEIIFSVLAAGLSLIPVVGGALGSAVTSASAFTAGLQNPTFSNAIFPTGTDSSQTVQIGDLEVYLRNVSTTLETRINIGLAAVQSDLSAFLAFTSSGNFSVPPDQLPNLPQVTDDLDASFNLFLVSSALTGNGYTAGVAPDYNPLAEYNDNPVTESNKFKCPAYDLNGQCSVWWYSSSTNASYALFPSKSNHDDANPTSVTSQVLSNWTTGSLLFDGAADCKAKGLAGHGVFIRTTTGQIDFSCLSQLKVCTWNKREVPEFTDCPDQSGFAPSPIPHDVLADVFGWAPEDPYTP